MQKDSDKPVAYPSKIYVFIPGNWWFCSKSECWQWVSENQIFSLHLSFCEQTTKSDVKEQKYNLFSIAFLLKQFAFSRTRQASLNALLSIPQVGKDYRLQSYRRTVILLYIFQEGDSGRTDNQGKIKQTCNVGGEFTTKDTRANSYSYKKSQEDLFQKFMKRIQDLVIFRDLIRVSFL